MTVERLECADDDRLAPYREVSDAALLRTRGLFVAEGRLVVRRVIEDTRYAVASVLLNDAGLRELEPSLRTLDPSVPVFVCRTADFAPLTGFNMHRGCLALVRRPPPAEPASLIGSAKLIVVLEAVTNADNVGAVFRSVAAFGADGVLLSPTACDPLYRKAIRTSMAAALSVPFARVAEDAWPAAIRRVRAAGFAIVALTPREPSEPLHVFTARPRPPRIALLVGTEGAGLTSEVESEADYRVRIPLAEHVDSLNLAVAAGIALYCLKRC
jgi:tRNA G18 (ribose-2'-O)-methylase SpoU